MHHLSNALMWCLAMRAPVAASAVVPRLPVGRRCCTRLLAACADPARRRRRRSSRNASDQRHIQALLNLADHAASVCLSSLIRFLTWRRAAAGAAACICARAVRGGARWRACRPGCAADRRCHACDAAGRGRGSGRPRRRRAGRARARRRAAARQARAQDARQGRPSGRGGGPRDGGAGRDSARSRWQRGRRDSGGLF